MPFRILSTGWFSIALWMVTPWTLYADDPKTAPAVSYDKQIRPIFQAHCLGCHQPAKAQSGYVMSSFDKLIQGGESGDAAIVAAHPEKSRLIKDITPVKGKAKMPPDGHAPLSESELDLIKTWIQQGAKNDSVTLHKPYSLQNLPTYTRAPVISAIDYSGDGKYLAIAGFNEVLLYSADMTKLEARLIGMAERIQSLRFSPNSEYLAVAGGLPARQGEVQVWKLADKKLVLSASFGYDTLYGISWSPDGSKIAFGCPDNTVRAIDAKTGQQVLQQGSHSDWPLDTAFNPKGTHLVSVSRDMTTKLTEVATQRFIDNITSITPGALRGGINSVVSHPTRDEIIVGGSDGKPKVYRIFRNVERKIGDDSNLIRELPGMPGRVNAVAITRDGKRIAAVSSLDMAGTLHIYGNDFDVTLTDELKQIMAKVATTRTPAEKKKLEEYHARDVKLIAQAKTDKSALFAVAFHPNGKSIAVAGADGQLRTYETNTGRLLNTTAIAPKLETAQAKAAISAARPQEAVTKETLPAGTTLVSLEPLEKQVLLRGPFDYAQLVVFGKVRSADGSMDQVDVTRQVKYQTATPVVTIDPNGLIRPLASGHSAISLTLGKLTAQVQVDVADFQNDAVDYVHDVMPVLSKMGCNTGTCHGAQAGKAGFKLSLRGYDPIYDVRAFTDDLASRRTNVASPENSLMLLKASANVPHTGGQLTKPGEAYYEIVKRWIGSGALLKADAPRVKELDIVPKNPIIQREGNKQQFRILATYTNGEKRDVTQEAVVESGNTEVATHNKASLLTAVRRGEAPILARFEGAYAATTLTVMGDRTGFTWQQPPVYNRIDELVALKWQRMKIRPSDVCSDLDFIRRAYLDLTGLPPTPEAILVFEKDNEPSRNKREALIDKLIGTPEFIDYWTNKWADLLQVNRKYLAPEGALAFRMWIRAEVEKNTPYDQFVRKVLTAKGSNKDNPPASYYKILRDPASMMENTTHLFLGVRFNCNKCHDHPFERWTQDNYYQTAAYFAQVGLKGDPASKDRKIGGTDVEGAKPFYEIVADMPTGDIKHDRTQQVTAPKFPYAATVTTKAEEPRRNQLAQWLTAKDNQYFARSYVNRVWGYLMGIGLIEPLDDIRAGNPPSNAELLDYLTAEFIKSDFNVRQLMSLIAKSRTYQLAVTSNRWNVDDKRNFSHATAKRLPAEVLYDTVYQVTGSITKIPGVPAGTRAAALPDVGVELPTGFLATLGRPVRESACECERSSGLQLGPVMALVNGQTVADAISDPDSALVKLVNTEKDDITLINQLFLRILNRPATPQELTDAVRLFREIGNDHAALTKQWEDREKWWVPVHAKREADRQAALAKTRADLVAHEKAIAPQRAEMEKQRLARVAQLEADLKKQEATLLTNKLAEYQKIKNDQVDWFRFNPNSYTGTNNAKIVKQDDLSLFASGELKRSDYTITAASDVKGITALRLEVLMDEKLPGAGPGRAPNGNFVLSQFEVTATSRKDPKQTKKLAFASATADYSQDGFAPAQLIDGKPNNQRGWAIVPNTGVTHWVVFQLKEPAGYEGGTIYTFKLLHRHSLADHTLGRFRLSASTSARNPVPIGLADEFQSILETPLADLTDKQKEMVLKHYRATDAELAKRMQELAASRMPLPIDARVKTLQGVIAELTKPTPLDGTLAQLRLDLEQSKKQLTNPRLTASQDLAWALINSPAFLFNH